MMNQELRVCQNCKTEFSIEPEDFAFYEKIQVPPPTWCPECRMVRRMLFRNQRTLYKRRVIGVDEEVFSVFPEDASFPVHYQKDWLSGGDDAVKYGKEYDFGRPFFAQLKELMRAVPWQHAYNQNAEDSEYCSNAIDLKNCYLMFNSGFSENCMYGSDVLRSRDSLDVADVLDSELSYELFHSEKCSRCFFSSDCVECADVWFSADLVNCHNCVGCVGLRHKQYCIFNKQYAKDEYSKMFEEFDFGSFRFIAEMKERLRKHKARYPVKFMRGYQNVDSSGDYLENSKDTRSSFISRGLENCAYCQMVLFMPGRDLYDVTIAGGERCYEISIGGGYNVFFSWLAGMSQGHTDVSYSMNCFNSSYLFGCVGLRNKKHCILNKQYEPEEYESLVGRIVRHMNEMPYADKRGRIYRYGEFFPPDLSPYPYNETIAQEFFPLSKEEALARGYGWRDTSPAAQHAITAVSDSLPDHIRDARDSITGEVVGCSHQGKCAEQCTGAFKITRQELLFYRKMNLPLPRLCHNCRHFERISQRNPLRLYSWKCACAGAISESGKYQNQTLHFHGENPCPNAFETSYPPERPEIVYCEACYQSEVV
ncbi:MAG: hypothetical protein HYT42_00280 [Candidatus Sungbacteria bacterium]|nr:hypothetical protein [Candidatus Sungbacteria bacterium]